MAHESYSGSQGVGIGGGTSVESLALSASSTLLAFGFLCPADANKAVDRVIIYCSAVTGTLVSGDIRCTLYDVNSSMNPNSSLGSTTTVTALPTGAAWVEFQFSSISITAGEMYYAVIDCPNAGSGRYITVRIVYTSGCLSNGGNATVSGSQHWAPNSKRSTDSGSTWASNTRVGVGSIRIQTSDPGYFGAPVLTHGNITSSYGVYAAREYGAYFTTPGDVKFRVRGIFGKVGKYGTTVDGKFKLYTGSSPSLQNTTKVIKAGALTNTEYTMHAMFPSVTVINPGTIVRIVFCTSDGSSGDSSNWMFCSVYTMHDDSNTYALGPFNGTWKETYYNGSSWTERSNFWPSIGMILDTDDLFDASAGGSGILVHPGMAGGMRG